MGKWSEMEKMKRGMRAAKMASDLEDVDLHRRLTEGKEAKSPNSPQSRAGQ